MASVTRTSGGRIPVVSTVTGRTKNHRQVFRKNAEGIKHVKKHRMTLSALNPFIIP